ncbi:unnamed protein product [Alopecurus aequalis]
MPPRPRGSRASPPVPAQEDEDVDFEVSYSDEEEGGGSDSSSEEGDTDVEDGERSDEEGESVAEGCGPSVPARVPGGATAVATTERAANSPACPVCMEPWTSEGAHRISCIPCGHVYGRSCLERWLTQRGSASATCPQCARRFKQKDIINIYAPEVVVPNKDLEKQILSCKEKVESLVEVVLKQGKLLEEIAEKNRSSTDVHVAKRQKIAERSVETTYLEPSASAIADHSSSNSCRFVLQNDLIFYGARVMGIDPANHIILASQKAPGVFGEHVLSKINMLRCQEERKIPLPPDTKVVKDICTLPGGSALYAALGRRLSLFRLLLGRVQHTILFHTIFMLACRMARFWCLIFVSLQDPCILWPDYLVIWFIHSTRSLLTVVPERFFLLLL